MITEQSKQQIIEAARVEDIVGDFVALKRRGQNMIGLCPFHNEKTPSFNVNPARNIYKCFGCGEGGDPVSFLMNYEQLSFPEALRYIANKYGIEIEETEVSQEAIEEKQIVDSLFIVTEFAKNYYQKQLFETDAGKSIGLSYFKSRGFREDTIRKWGLGITPKKKDEFTKIATDAGYNLDLLRKLGLTNRYDSDFFRERVVFTIRNLTGKIIAFAGRTLSKDKKIPKYINSPETEIYVKNKVLYGIHFAKKAIRKEEECILVEGYTDVISLHQAGIENVVASSGTSLTVGQINLIRRYTPNIKILYDGDAAGIKAALRGLDLILEQDMNVRVVLLPEGEDPDSYLQSVGTAKFKEYISEHSEDFILFKANLLLEEAGNDPIKRTALVRDIVESIAHIPDAIKRSFYTKRCSELLYIDENILVDETQKMMQKILAQRAKERQREERQKQRANNASLPPAPPMPTDGSFPSEEYAPMPTSEQDYSPAPTPSAETNISTDIFQEKDVARILVCGGGKMYDESNNKTVAQYIIEELEGVIEHFENPLYSKIVQETVEMLKSKQTITEDTFIRHTDENIKRFAIDCFTPPHGEMSPNWKEKKEIRLSTQKAPELNFPKDSEGALLRFKLKKVIKMAEQNQARLKDLKPDEQDKMMLILKVQIKLNQMRDELAKQMSTVILK